LHDAIASEHEGTPAVGVMTAQFVSAAELMSRVLGLPDYDFCVIEHPVSSSTDQGLQARAAATVEALRRIVLAGDEVAVKQ
jgi:hypothetical protein